MRLGVVLGVLLLAACSHQAKRVDCDQHLVPINAPAPLSKDSPAKSMVTP